MKLGSLRHWVLVAAPLGIMCSGAANAEQPGQQNRSGSVTTERLLKIIDAQQNQIDAQQKQLQMQTKAIQDLRQRVKALAGAHRDAKAAQSKSESPSAETRSKNATAKGSTQHPPMIYTPAVLLMVVCLLKALKNERVPQ